MERNFNKENIMALEKFSKVKQCKKCYSKDVSRIYCTKGEDDFYSSTDLHTKNKLKSGEEHFDMHCRDCQFSWQEGIKK